MVGINKRGKMRIFKERKLFFVGILIILALFVFDIWTKRLAFESVNNIYQKTAGIHNHIRITSFFNIVRVVNYGVSFGLFSDLKYGQFILSAITIIIVAFVIYLLWKTDKKYDTVVYSMIIAGGLGNLYDRVIYGGVFDFLDFHIWGYHWPAFNVADSLICVGIGLILLNDLLKFLNRKHN